MKNTICFLLAWMITYAIRAQVTKSESLKPVEAEIKSDTAEISGLMARAAFYADRNDDSALLFFGDAIQKAQKSGDTKNELLARYKMASYMNDVKSDYIAALSLFLQNIKQEEQIHDYGSIFFDMRGALFVYEYVGDYIKELEYAIKMRDLINTGAIKDSAKRAEYNAIADFRLGVVYEELNEIDSARPYLQRIYNLGVFDKDLTWIALGGMGMGDISAKQDQLDSASYYYHASGEAALKIGRIDLYSGAIMSLAEFYWNSKKQDSAYSYAMQSYKTGKSNVELGVLIAAASLLAKIYDVKKRPDSAYFYLSQSVQLKDSLLSAEKIFKVKNISFNEAIREQQVAEQKKREAESHIRNLQLLGIGVFIPIFFFLVLFLSRTRVRPRVIEFLGLLSLLLFFEFITDLIYPYVSSLTNENPIWDLLLLVILASLLEPLNFRLEHWVKKRLAHKPIISNAQLTVENMANYIE